MRSVTWFRFRSGLLDIGLDVVFIFGRLFSRRRCSGTNIAKLVLLQRKFAP